MPEGIAGATGYFQTGVFIYGNSACLGAACFITLVGGMHLRPAPAVAREGSGRPQL